MSENKEVKVFPFIEGENIYLSPSNIDNIHLYTKWMNDPQLRKYARYDIPQTVEEVKKKFEPTKEEVKRNIFFEIWHKKDNKLIGYVCFIRIDWFTRNAHIFYLIGDTDYWGQNFATEAAKLVVNYGFNELNLHKITARTFSQNKASLRVAEKIGFKYDITLKQEAYIDGEYVDALHYVIFKNEWKSSQ
jgi:RimJ/RimL family protein N-acetyltransferase